jgi:hypothetical protein
MALSIADLGYVLQTGKVVLADGQEPAQEPPDARGLPRRAVIGAHGLNRQGGLHQTFRLRGKCPVSMGVPDGYIVLVMDD